MDAVMQLLISTNPFGYISKNLKKVLNDFLACDSLGESYAYQYLNSSYYKELILLICLMVSYKNISNGEKINVDNLDIGTNILFQKEYYIFEGRDKINEGYYILTPTYKKKSPVTRILKKNVIENEASIVSDVKRRKVSNTKEDFGKQLGLSSISWTNEDSVIIILEKKILNEIMNVQFNINGKNSYLGEFCIAKYLKETIVFEQLPHSNFAEKPMVIFSSNIGAVIEYLDENDGDISEKRVYVIGDKWFSNGQFSNLFTLEDACDDFGIPMTVFSSIPSVMDESKLKFLEKMDREFCWLESKEFSKMEISFEFVSSNEEFDNAITKLNEYIGDIREIPRLKYLDKLLKRFLKMNYSQVIGYSRTLEQQMIIVSEYMEKLNLEETEKISGILYDIYCNRFGFQNKKIIESIRSKDKCALVVMDEMVEETKKIYMNDDTITVLPYSEKIYEDLYGTFDSVILLSPYARDRKKWLSSYLTNKLFVVSPDLQEKYLMHSLKRDKRIIQHLYTLDNSYSDRDSAYLKAINKYFEKTMREKQVNNNCDDKVLYDELDKEEDPQKEYLSLINNLIITTSEIETESEKQLVNVVRGIDLESGKNIFGTEFGKFFILQENFCRKTDVNNIQIGQNIVEFEVAYSDTLYREQLKKYNFINGIFIDSTLDENLRLDYFWKMILLEYIKEREMTPTQFKERMDELGAIDKSITFYGSWSSIDKMPILPRDSSFIYYIGLLTKNSELTNEPDKYYSASTIVKKNLNYERDRLMDSIDGRKLNEIIKDSSIKSYSVDKVILVEDIDIEDVPRYLTNKFLGGKS
ncbi:hypothetical protein EG868_08050 [Enterococcus faecalis]|uniref:hypothetical protein n=1 Tax=Enterococcus faecalis TaxID=1351 RepID=UPI00032DF9E3|nr:hypothetical protein [Enterococcus faecalis]EOJ99537.1 hypothetical protein WOQ_01755 [Enterococcus faecalis EnGen0340]RXF33111.1 hypothetical protein EG868_08050 [Enterococcus faecalis]